jgi:uncharacterized protein (TIRG00374 family)
MRRRILLIVASIIISVVFLVLVLRDVPLNEVLSALGKAHWLWVLACFAIVFIGLWTRAVRWRGLLDNRIGLQDAFFIMGITFMLNQLPLRAGEVARSLLATRHKLPFVTAATSIVVERLLDTLLVVLLIAWSVAQLPDIDPQVTRGATLFGIAGVFGFAVLLFFAHYPQIAHKFLTIIIARVAFLERLPLPDWLDHVLDGLKPLTNWGTFAHALLWTLISWVFSLLGLYTSIRALGIEESPLIATTLGISLASLSIAIPATVAGIGLIEGAIKLAGNIVGMPDVASTALGFLLHGITIFGYIVVGIAGMWLQGVSLDELLKGEKTDSHNKV